MNEPTYSHQIRWRNTSQIKNFFVPGLLGEKPDLEDFIHRIDGQIPDSFENWSSLSKAQYLESTLFMSNYLLSSQGDRMAMANSVEGRFPFLDHRVVELAARMPDKLRLNGLTEKFILKQIARYQVPSELIDRSKQPYRAPISQCFICPQPPEYVMDLLSEPGLKRAGYFDLRKVKNLITKCQQHGGSLTSERENMAMVAILSTQLLDQQFIQDFPDFSKDVDMSHTVVARQDS